MRYYSEATVNGIIHDMYQGYDIPKATDYPSIEITDNSWHTEPPTKEGDYVVLCSTDGEYMVCHLEANLKPEIFHKYFKAWWGEKIEPYKEEEDGHTD